MRVHLDGDVLVYRAGFAAEHTFWSVEWMEGDLGFSREFESRKELDSFMEDKGLNPIMCVVRSRREVEPLENALFNARSMISKVCDAMETDDVVVYLSGPTNYRLGVATTKPYKGNRDEAHKPVHAPEIKAMLRREYNVVTSADQEADDDIAIAHYSMWVADPYSSVIATIDKDLDMVPGLHYNFAKDERYEVSPDEGIWNFYKQCLVGDTTDNIPGIRGIGPVKAAKLLPPVGSSESDLARCVMEEYRKAYGDDGPARLTEVGRLLWMRRHPNEWWNPPEVV